LEGSGPPLTKKLARCQNFPELKEIEDVAETCEFDGKEPLFGERAIRISKEFWDE